MTTSIRWLGIFDRRYLKVLLSWVWEKQGGNKTGDVDALIVKHLKTDLEDSVSRIENHGILIVYPIPSSDLALVALGDDAVELEIVLTRIKDIISMACDISVWEAKNILDHSSNISLIIAEIITAGSVERLTPETVIKFSTKFTQIPVPKSQTKDS
jgi:hypothetical protein